jgi:hypothetical protein
MVDVKIGFDSFIYWRREMYHQRPGIHEKGISTSTTVDLTAQGTQAWPRLQVCVPFGHVQALSDHGV